MKKGDIYLSVHDLITRTVLIYDIKGNYLSWVRNTDGSVAVMKPEHFFMMQTYNSFVKVRIEKMERVNNFKSSNIQSIGYEEFTMTLEVIFKPRGSVYYYKDVPKEIWEQFKNSESKGTYFARFIKDKYATVKA